MAERNPEQNARRMADLKQHLTEHPLEEESLPRRFSKQPEQIVENGQTDFRQTPEESRRRASLFMFMCNY